jgi:hypothetical protein
MLKTVIAKPTKPKAPPLATFNGDALLGEGEGDGVLDSETGGTAEGNADGDIDGAAAGAVGGAAAGAVGGAEAETLMTLISTFCPAWQ